MQHCDAKPTVNRPQSHRQPMTRLVSGLALAAAALAAVVLLPIFMLRLVACGVAVLAAHEYLRIVGSRRHSATLVLVALTCWFIGLSDDAAVLPLLLMAFAWLAAEVLWQGVSLHDAAARFVAPWYVGAPLGMLAGIHASGGPPMTLVLLATVVVSDSAQYYVGRLFGRRPLAPAISPKKTIEGALGGIAFGTLFMTFAGVRVLGGAQVPLAILGGAIVVLGICGDLFESRLKRASGIKDSSALIPGHGGVLDRIDALLFATPAFYLYLRG
jgi:phosphatidate cytidylyltransferase